MKRTPLKRGDSQLKRTEMKRGGSNLQRSEMKRGGSNLPRSNLKARSKARSKVMRDDRVPMIRRLNEAEVGCQVCPILESVGISTLCAVEIQGVHERRKRSSAGSLVNKDNLVPACNWGNGWIEDNPKLVRDLTGTALVVREGDEEWDSLSKRNDR